MSTDASSAYTSPLAVNVRNSCCCCGTIVHAIRRVFFTPLLAIRLDPWEDQSLKEAGIDPTIQPVSARYAVLRNSALTGCLFFTAVYCFLTVLYVMGLIEQITKALTEKYMKKALSIVLGVIVFIVVALLIGFFFALKAKFSWTNVPKSRRFIRVAFCLMIFPVFFVHILMNYGSYIDWDEAISETCQEVVFDDVNSVQNLFSFMDNHSRPVGGSFEPLRLPDDFCSNPPNEWAGILNNTIRKSGFVDLNERHAGSAGRSKTCPRAQSFAAALVIGTSAAAPGELELFAAQACQAGGMCYSCSECITLYTYYMSCRALAKTNVNAMDLCHSSTPDLKHCEPCYEDFEIQPDSGKTVNCVDVCLLIDRNATAGLIQFVSQGSGGDFASNMCLKQTEVDNMRSAIQALQFAKFTIMLGQGLQEGIESASNLLPIAVGQIMGMQRGLIISKIIVPEMRLPGILLGSSIVFSAPFLLSVLGIFQSILGNYMLSIALVFLACGFFIMLPVGDLQRGKGETGNEGIIGPQFEEAAHAEFATRKRVQLFLYFLSLVFVGLWLYTSDMRKAFYESLDEDDKEEVEGLLIQRTIWQSVNLILSTFGKSLICFVFFLDGVVELLVREHLSQEEDNHKAEFTVSRTIRMEQLCGITGLKKPQADTDIEVQAEQRAGVANVANSDKETQAEQLAGVANVANSDNEAQAEQLAGVANVASEDSKVSTMDIHGDPSTEIEETV